MIKASFSYLYKNNALFREKLTVLMKCHVIVKEKWNIFNQIFIKMN